MHDPLEPRPPASAPPPSVEPSAEPPAAPPPPRQEPPESFSTTTQSPAEHDAGAAPRRGPLSLLVDILAAPVDAFRYLSSHRHVGLAFLVAVASSLTFSASPGDVLPLKDGATLPAPVSWLVDMLSAAVVLVLLAGIYHVTARVLGGRNSYVFALQAVGFSTLPNVLAAPVYAVARFVDVGSLVGFVNLGVAVWTTVLAVIALREVYRFSTLRAVVAYFIPIVIAVILWLVLFALVFGALIIGV